MAAKKTEEVNTEEVKTEEVMAEVITPKDPWDVQVDMIVPRKPRGEDQQYYICVNDRRYLVPANGQMQKLPQPIAEVLAESLAAEAEADDFADHIPNRSAEQLVNQPI